MDMVNTRPLQLGVRHDGYRRTRMATNRAMCYYRIMLITRYRKVLGDGKGGYAYISTRACLVSSDSLPDTNRRMTQIEFGNLDTKMIMSNASIDLVQSGRL
jgi:hypothetical protein